MNGQMRSYDRYWEQVKKIPEPSILSEPLGTTIDLRGLAEYGKKTGKTGADLTDEELAMFVGNVAIVRDFYARHSAYCSE